MNNIPPEMQKWVEIFLSDGGIWVYLVVAGIMLIEYVFPPTPGDVVIFSAGFLCGDGRASLFVVLLCAYLGSAIGLSIVFAVGKKYGRNLFESGKLKFLKTSMRDKTEALFQKSGSKLLLISKFLPGVRFALVFFAGLADISFKKAFVLTSISCLIWNSLIILMAFYLQKNLELILKVLSMYSAAVLIVVLGGIIAWVAVKIYKRRISV